MFIIGGTNQQNDVKRPSSFIAKQRYSFAAIHLLRIGIIAKLCRLQKLVKLYRAPVQTKNCGLFRV
jgi:hypothetical protein